MAYHDFENIEICMEALLPLTRQLELYVIENPSEFTQPLIKPYFFSLLNQGLISKYILFDRNISNNALEIFFDSICLEIEDHEYLLVTDGDLLPQGSDWLAEQLTIMATHNEVFACGIKLSLENLPVDTMPDASNWVAMIESETDSYEESATGMHLVLFRGAEFREFLKYRRHRNLKFVDTVIRQYCREVVNRKWARTKRNTAIHLTWNRYKDLNHPYTKLKLQKSFKKTWFHDSYCGGVIYSRKQEKRFIPLRKVLRSKLVDIKHALRTVLVTHYSSSTR